MLNSISKLGGASEKIGSWTGKISAARLAMLNKLGESSEPKKPEFSFTRPTLRDTQRRNEVIAITEEPLSEAIVNGDALLFDKDVQGEDQTEFSSRRVTDEILAQWEIQAEDNPCNDSAAEGLETAEPFTPPHLLGFNPEFDDVELEYMVVSDPVTGKSVTPFVTVERSEDGKAGNLFLNGKLVACVVGAQDLDAEDVKLVKVSV
jgi:hypothetical protein